MTDKPVDPLGPIKSDYSWIRKDRYTAQDENTLKCAKCGNDFLVELRVNRYKDGETGVVGQPIPMMNELNFPIYLCINPDCFHLTLPAIDGSITGRQWDLFQRLCNLVEKETRDAHSQF